MSVRIDHDLTICFRVDASELIGTGHVMRCLTLARELRGRGAACVFVCREHPGHLGGLIAQQDFEVRLLAHSFEDGLPDTNVSPEGEPVHSHWIGATWLQDARETAALIQGREIDWLVVDHYGLDRRWEEALSPHCGRILAIDDLADRPHFCDLLLDQNIVARMQTRYEGLVPANCGLLLGPHYALLQPDYGDLHDRVPPREGVVGRVLVYFGGADLRNLTGMAVDAFAAIEAPYVTLDVVINRASPHADAIRSKAASDARVALHEQLPSLAPLMVGADLAIGASGTTTWERLCLGLPTLVVTLAVNQVPIAAELDRQGLIRWLGDVGEMDADRLRVALADVLAEPLPETWSQACANSVDGQGLVRVAQHLLLGPATPLRARPARLADEDLLLEWANDPETRRNAFSSEPIAASTHRAWFRSRLRRLEECLLLIVESDEGLPLGQVRLDKKQDAWEISYGLSPSCRGRGLGEPVLRAGLAQFGLAFPGARSIARVKLENFPSRRIFTKLGFSEAENADSVVTFSSPPPKESQPAG